jgi:hypothetical protein
MKMTTFNGLDCIELSNEHLILLVTQSVGPRILSLRNAAGENLFAELPELTMEYPGRGPFHFYGSHRLWYAPEDLVHTCLPDDESGESLSHTKTWQIHSQAAWIDDLAAFEYLIENG